MRNARPRPKPTRRLPGPWAAAAWLAASAGAALALALVEPARAAAVAPFAVGGFGLALAAAAWRQEARWAAPLRRVAGQVEALALDPASGRSFDEAPPVGDLARALNRLSSACRRLAAASPPAFTRPGDSGTTGARALLTRSGLLETTSDAFEAPFDAQASGEFATADMVNRLDPRLLRWQESSPAEQEFLGWTLRQLREKSFLEIVHPDDLDRVRDQLRGALVRGEAHGLVLRIRTAHGKPRAIEMNVSARYGPDMAVSHLRCHVTDVTAKVRSERELRLRTRELTQVNDQLRIINRELEELKERYRDLYQNAPAMYFSVDEAGTIQECNDTLLRTLGYRREAVVGLPYERLLPESARGRFAEKFARFVEAGTIEAASQWVKAGGEVIDVWVTGTAARGPDGRIVLSRSVAQDVTARYRLEAELHEKNDRLARTIDELSRRNREMDEFTYVVSHDLQEPLRTLTAFSDFLLRDYGDRLDAGGQEFVQYIVDASRRMRALILDLMTLSRAGKVTDEFAAVNLEEVVALTRADLAERVRARGAEVRVVGVLPEVWGDRARIGQLLTNLVTNALKYNDKPDPRVEIGTAPDAPAPDPADGDPWPPGWVTLYVRDNGIGIEPEFHAKIFQLFRRLHTREEYEGTGAGLAIAAKIVRAHGGRIWVESEPGRGATFFVTLRRPPADAGADALAAEVPHAT